MLYGLKESTINSINNILSQYDEIDEVILYGSRAKGNYRPGSDIDLTIKGEHIKSDQLFKMMNQFDDLLLPYEIDISLFRQLNNDALIDHINRVGLVFYKK